MLKEKVLKWKKHVVFPFVPFFEMCSFFGKFGIRAIFFINFQIFLAYFELTELLRTLESGS